MSGTEARNVIAQELLTHRLERCTTSSATESIQWWQCSGCGFKSCTFPIKGMRWEVLQQEIAADHLAVQIDTALGGLTREWGVVIDYPPRLDDNYPGAVVILDTYKLREAAEIVKRDKYPQDCYEIRPRWVSGWNEAPQ